MGCAVRGCKGANESKRLLRREQASDGGDAVQFELRANAGSVEPRVRDAPRWLLCDVGHARGQACYSRLRARDSCGRATSEARSLTASALPLQRPPRDGDAPEGNAPRHVQLLPSLRRDAQRLGLSLPLVAIRLRVGGRRHRVQLQRDLESRTSLERAQDCRALMRGTSCGLVLSINRIVENLIRWITN